MILIMMLLITPSYAGYAIFNYYIGTSNSCSGDQVMQAGVVTDVCLAYPVSSGYQSVLATCNNLYSNVIAYQYSNCTGKSVNQGIPNGICTDAGDVPIGGKQAMRMKAQASIEDIISILGVCQTSSVLNLMPSAALVENVYVGSTNCNSVVDIFEATVLNECLFGSELTCVSQVPELQIYLNTDCQGKPNQTIPEPITSCVNNGSVSISTTCTLASPTSSPTFASTSLSVNMELASFPYSNYLLNQMLYIGTIIETIVNSTNVQLQLLGTSGSISGLNIANVVISSSTLSRKLTSNVQVSYQISSAQSSVSQSSLTSAVTNSYTTGSFNNALHYYAQSNNATGLTAVTLAAAPSVIGNSPTPSPTSTPVKVNAGVIAGAVVGAVVFISLIVLGYIYMRKKQSKTIKNVTTGTETVSPIVNNNPITHRISQTESTLTSSLVSSNA